MRNNRIHGIGDFDAQGLNELWLWLQGRMRAPAATGRKSGGGGGDIEWEDVGGGATAMTLDVTDGSLDLPDTTELFIGTGLTLSNPGGAGVARVDGSGGYNLIEDEGSSLTQRATLNFIGPGVKASDSSSPVRTNVNIVTPYAMLIWDGVAAGVQEAGCTQGGINYSQFGVTWFLLDAGPQPFATVSSGNHKQINLPAGVFRFDYWMGYASASILDTDAWMFPSAVSGATSALNNQTWQGGPNMPACFGVADHVAFQTNGFTTVKSTSAGVSQISFIGETTNPPSPDQINLLITQLA